MTTFIVIFVLLLILKAFLPSPTDIRARPYIAKIEQIVGGPVTGGKMVHLHGKLSKGEEMLAKAAFMRRELQLLRREFVMRCNEIKARFRGRASQAPGSGFVEGIQAGMFGWRTFYRVRGRVRESERARRYTALAPLEKAISTIDALVLQIDAGSLNIEQAIERRDDETRSQPATNPMPSDPSAIKLQGTITWNYSGAPSESFPVTRAFLRSPGILTIDCDCGTPHDPYIYTIQTHSDDGVHFEGRFSAGRSARGKSEGKVSGVCEQIPSGYRLTGVWIEGSDQSEWVAELVPVQHFPDERTHA